MVKQLSYHSPENSTVNILLWGKEGVGKTYLSSSMPKKVLYLTFDSNALNGLNDLIVSGKLKKEDVPYLAYDEGDYKEISNAYKNPANPFGLNQIYDECKFETLVIDSLTSFFKLAMQYAIELAGTYDLKEKPTIERPQLVGYGIRSTATKEMVFNVINWCNKHKVNCVLIAHKGDMIKDEATGALFHGIQLSGDIPNEIARQCDECWLLGVNNTGNRSLLVQPTNNIRPLKSRMFASDVRNVDADNIDLTKLIEAWQSEGKITNQVLINMKG